MKVRERQPGMGLIRRGFSEEADVVEGTQVPGKEGRPASLWGVGWAWGSCWERIETKHLAPLA